MILVDFLNQNPHFVRDKVCVDIGCGTGVKSLLFLCLSHFLTSSDSIFSNVRWLGFVVVFVVQGKLFYVTMWNFLWFMRIWNLFQTSILVHFVFMIGLLCIPSYFVLSSLLLWDLIVGEVKFLLNCNDFKRMFQTLQQKKKQLTCCWEVTFCMLLNVMINLKECFWVLDFRNCWLRTNEDMTSKNELFDIHNDDDNDDDV